VNCSFESNIINIEFAFVIQVGSEDIGLCRKCKIAVSLTRQGFKLPILEANVKQDGTKLALELQHTKWKCCITHTLPISHA
jgi:hypothetical protein